MSATPYAGMGYYSGLVSALTGQLTGEAEAEKREQERQALALKTSILMADKANQQARAEQAAGFREKELGLSEQRHQLAVKKFEQPKPEKTAALTPYQTENLRQKKVGFEADLASNAKLLEKVKAAKGIMDKKVTEEHWYGDETEDVDTGMIDLSIIDPDAKEGEKVSRAEILEKLAIDRKRLEDLISGGAAAPVRETDVVPGSVPAAQVPAGVPGAPVPAETVPVVSPGATEIDTDQVVSVAIQSLGSNVKSDRLQAKQYLLEQAKAGNQEAREALLRSIGR